MMHIRASRNYHPNKYFRNAPLMGITVVLSALWLAGMFVALVNLLFYR